MSIEVCTSCCRYVDTDFEEMHHTDGLKAYCFNCVETKENEQHYKGMEEEYTGETK